MCITTKINKKYKLFNKYLKTSGKSMLPNDCVMW